MAQNHRMLWNADDLGADFVRPLIARGELVAAHVGGELAGVCTLTRHDPEFWPEDAPGAAAYLHKLAVRRAFAGGGVTGAIFGFCAQAARAWGCPALKLDCDPTLGRVYVRAGFRRVDQRTITPAGRAPFVVDRFAMPLG
jgi:GNAT superfamily N-acetyltransferase